VSLAQFIPAVEESRRRPSPRDQAYAAFLDAILSLGLLQDIPVAEGSRRHPLVRVSLPFCGALSEAPRLLPFLATHINQTPCALELHGCDIDDSPSAYWWPAWEEWTANLHGDRCSLCFQKKDLATERLPVAHFGLVLGIHPLVMGVGCEASWRRIMQNVLNSCQPGGKCVFATFYSFEATSVQRLCKDHGFSAEIRENPHYAMTRSDQAGTHLRFLVFVHC